MEIFEFMEFVVRSKFLDNTLFYQYLPVRSYKYDKITGTNFAQQYSSFLVAHQVWFTGIRNVLFWQWRLPQLENTPLVDAWPKKRLATKFALGMRLKVNSMRHLTTRRCVLTRLANFSSFLWINIVPYYANNIIYQT